MTGKHKLIYYPIRVEELCYLIDVLREFKLIISEEPLSTTRAQMLLGSKSATNLNNLLNKSPIVEIWMHLELGCHSYQEIAKYLLGTQLQLEAFVELQKFHSSSTTGRQDIKKRLSAKLTKITLSVLTNVQLFPNTREGGGGGGGDDDDDDEPDIQIMPFVFEEASSNLYHVEYDRGEDAPRNVNFVMTLRLLSDDQDITSTESAIKELNKTFTFMDWVYPLVMLNKCKGEKITKQMDDGYALMEINEIIETRYPNVPCLLIVEYHGTLPNIDMQNYDTITSLAGLFDPVLEQLINSMMKHETCFAMLISPKFNVVVVVRSPELQYLKHYLKLPKSGVLPHQFKIFCHSKDTVGQVELIHDALEGYTTSRMLQDMALDYTQARRLEEIGYNELETDSDTDVDTGVNTGVDGWCHGNKFEIKPLEHPVERITEQMSQGYHLLIANNIVKTNNTPCIMNFLYHGDFPNLSIRTCRRITILNGLFDPVLEQMFKAMIKYGTAYALVKTPQFTITLQILLGKFFKNPNKFQTFTSIPHRAQIDLQSEVLVNTLRFVLKGRNNSNYSKVKRMARYFT